MPDIAGRQHVKAADAGNENTGMIKQEEGELEHDKILR